MKKVAVVGWPLALALALLVFSSRESGPADVSGGIGGPALAAAVLEEAEQEGLPEAVLAAPSEDIVLMEFSRPQMVLYTAYTIVPGDMIGPLAASYGLNQDTLVSVNGIRNTRTIRPGQVLKIPNQDGILHQVRAGETLGALAARYQVDAGALRTVNELFSDRINTGTGLFIPGARLNYTDLQEINGDLFSWPLRGWISSNYGYRRDPFGGSRQFHTGLDIAAPMGLAVRAALSGRVSFVGYNEVMGNYVVLTHHSGYRSLYGHLSATSVRSGRLVNTGEKIGEVGSTGLSTGPHLHFTVYKNGATVNPRALMR